MGIARRVVIWQINRMNSKSDCQYYPQSYAHSRKSFLEQVQKLGPNVQTEQWLIPSKTDTDLFVDSAYWPAEKTTETLIVVTSGIHGSETYAGSAIQQMLMQEILPRLNRAQVGVLFVHAMNPYGFKHHCRTTEAGVNLNRNFSVSGELYNTANSDSAQMHEQFYVRQKVSSPRSSMMDSLVLKDGTAFFNNISMDQFTKATAPGQFIRPEDLEFGGKQLEPQSKKLIEKLRGLMPQYRDIIALDLHTGLGDRNRLHLLTSGSGADLNPELFALLFDPVADQKIYEHTSATADGFYEVHGALNSMFVDLASPQNRVCAITMEFGTLGHSLEAQLEGLNSFVVDHQGLYYGFSDSAMEARVRTENFERSYPQNDEWRGAVIEASRSLFENIARRAQFLRA